MSDRRVARAVVLALVLGLPAVALADVAQLARCQKAIAREGAGYAKKVITDTLNCTTRTADCQIQCENGVFGPVCDPAPPPCCDSSDRNSNATFGACMDAADVYCAAQNEKIATAELRKQTNITNACALVTQEELCSTQMVGLNFDALNAGCLALDPSYTCSLPNLLNCVAGPLEHQLLDQISTLLHPRASDAVTALGLTAEFADIPTVRRVKQTVPAGKADVWELTGSAGDDVVVRVNTRDDGGGTSTLHPTLAILEGDGTPIASTTVRTIPCNVPNVCGSGCPQFKRTLPFDGAYRLAVIGANDGGCGGGGYKLVITSPSGSPPQLIEDDVPASSVVGP